MIDQLTLYIATAISGLIVGGAFTYIAATSERFAAPRRAKAPEDRTLTDKLIIEADRRIDLINIQQLETFLTSFVAAHLDTIIKNAPVIGPMATAADYVDDALEAFRRRNPQLAAATGMSAKTMQEKLAGAIGQAAKPVIAKPADDGWRAPKVPTVNVPAFSIPQPYRASDPMQRVQAGDPPGSISSDSLSANK